MRLASAAALAVALWGTMPFNVSGAGGLTARHLGQWQGEAGTEAIQGPRALAVDATGLVYIVESTHRVQVFTGDGRFVRRWGTQGSGPGQFFLPTGIAVDSAGASYVSDLGLGTSSSRVQKFAPDGAFLAAWRGIGLDHFDYARGVGVDSSGNVYVADWGKHRVVMLAPDGTLVREWARSEFLPSGVAVDDERGLVYAADQRTRREGTISVGYFVMTPLSQDGGFGEGWTADRQPDRIALDRQGRLYGTLGSSVKVYTPQGALIGEWGSGGSGPGEFGQATGIAVDDRGLVYVADFVTGRIQVFQVEFD